MLRMKPYLQLINNLPNTEKAEASLLNRTFNFPNDSGSPQDHGYVNFRESKVAHFKSGDLSCSSVSGDYADDQWNCSGPIIYISPCIDPPTCIAVETFAYECSQGTLEADWFWGQRPTNAPQVSAKQVSTNDVCSSVGGVAEAPDLNQLNENLDTKNKDNTLTIASGVAAAAAAITATGAAFYINRRRSS